MRTKELEKLFRALGNKRRLRIIKLFFKDGEISVSDVASAIKLSLKATSRHLLNLFNAEVIEREQRSKNVYYKIPNHLNQPIKDLINHIHHSNE